MSGEGVNREGEAEKEREGDRIIITVESFCRGIFQNDWAHCRNGGMPCSFAIHRGLRIARRCEGKRRKGEGERRRAPCVTRRTQRGGDRKGRGIYASRTEGCGLGRYTYRGRTNGEKEIQGKKKDMKGGVKERQ